MMQSNHFRVIVWLALVGLARIVPVSAQETEAGGADPGAGGEHPLAAAIRIATESHKRAVALEDYQAVFTKSEMVRGRMHSSKMQMKFRQEPFSVYLKFINRKHAGREVLYVEGQNNNMMLAHETGLKALAGTVPVDPKGQLALSEARHPITRIGMAKLSEGIVKQWRKESEYGESEVQYYPEATLDERPMLVIESTHPTPRNQFPFAITRLWVDQETKLPVRVQNYEFPRRPGQEPVLVEDYIYTDIKSNTGLTDRDFDRRNPAYSF